MPGGGDFATRLLAETRHQRGARIKADKPWTHSAVVKALKKAGSRRFGAQLDYYSASP
jgi:hypothetical protein